jgi:hypothetical protein
MLDTVPVTRLLVATVALGTVAAGAALLAPRAPHAATLSVLEPSAYETAVTSSVSSATHEPSAAATDRSEVFLVFHTAGHTFIQLDTGAAPHGVPQLSHSEDDGLYASIAAVTRVPTDAPVRIGQRVNVDGTCAATVMGFAVVSRLTGDTGYAGIEDERWTANNVMEHGPPVLAARLSGCTGTYAQAATLPAVVLSDETARPDLVQAATDRLFASEAATTVQAEWANRRDEWPANEPARWTQSPSTHVDARVLRHPATGVTWIAVHASRGEGCGDIDANVFGLFRVTAAGVLETVQLRELGELHTIQSFVDLDGDGTPELVGRDWLSLNTLITRASGETLTSSHLQFFGCGC